MCATMRMDLPCKMSRRRSGWVVFSECRRGFVFSKKKIRGESPSQVVTGESPLEEPREGVHTGGLQLSGILQLSLGMLYVGYTTV